MAVPNTFVNGDTIDAGEVNANFSYVDDAITAGIVPSGSVLDFAGASAPTGWFLCYGQAVSRTTYASLFSVIGTAFGTGDGSTTFNLPDLRGRVAAGIDNMGGSDAGRLSSSNTIGTAVGAETVLLTKANMPTQVAIATNGWSSGLMTFGGANTFLKGVSDAYEAAGNTAHSNMQPTMVLNKIIKQ